MAKRSCIFCGQTPVTKEHVVPQWITGVLKRDPRGFPSRVTHKRTPDIGQSYEWSGGEVIDITAKCVCRRCNVGWMSQLEARALPLLQWMMMGRAISLGTDEQSLLASWIALRALLFRYTHQPVDPPEREWLAYFYEHHSPPPTCYQWIAAYNGNKVLHYSGNVIKMSRMPGKPRKPSWETPNGILMTLVVNHLVAKLIWIRKGEPGNLDPPGLVRIWPASDKPVTWPPNTAMDDVGLESLIKMFLSAP